MKKPETEKDRLMREVLGKRRTMNIELKPDNSFDIGELKREIQADFGVALSDESLGRQLDNIMENHELLLKKRARSEEDTEATQEDMDHFEKMFKMATLPVLKEQYAQKYENAVRKVYGQHESVKGMVNAFLRPYVTKHRKQINLIYLYGPKGSGRHHLLNTVVEEVYSEKNIYLLDLAKYQTASAETIFIQDIYGALESNSPVILMENFHLAHPSVTKMLVSLITKGHIDLEHRYIEKNGGLEQKAMALHDDMISRINGNSKTIVFISEKEPSALMNKLGKAAFDGVSDKIGTVELNASLLSIIMDEKLEALALKFEESLGKIEIDESVKRRLAAIYEPEQGVHSFLGIIAKIEESFVDLVLEKDFVKESNFSLKHDGEFYLLGSDEVRLELNTDDESMGQIAKIKEEIDQIIGLDHVKNYLYSLEDVVRAGKLRSQKGLKTEAVTKHMIFTGNPGTGKTTIARLVAKLFKAIGVLRQGHLVEVTRADLVGRYVGHTAPLTMSVINSALGGVLFIDEAYSLYRGRDDSFGLEAIDTLVKAMEDNRDNLVVILAGYVKEMEYFLSSNSGLRSRFPKSVDFADYSAEELRKIACIIARSKQYEVASEVLGPMEMYFKEVLESTEAEGGISANGRMARNIVEAAIIKQSGRVIMEADSGSEAELNQLILNDFDFSK